jgi:hypothetical protein
VYIFGRGPRFPKLEAIKEGGLACLPQLIYVAKVRTVKRTLIKSERLKSGIRGVVVDVVVPGFVRAVVRGWHAVRWTPRRIGNVGDLVVVLEADF